MEVVGPPVVRRVHPNLQEDVRELHPRDAFHREELPLVQDVLRQQSLVQRQGVPGRLAQVEHRVVEVPVGPPGRGRTKGAGPFSKKTKTKNLPLPSRKGTGGRKPIYPPKAPSPLPSLSSTSSSLRS